MTKDLNHEICNIEFICINLPSRVEFLDGSRVLYTYDAKGTKLRTDYYINPMSAVVPQTANEQGASSANLRHTWTDYCGNFIYENDTLKQTLIDGGYISYVHPQNTSVTSISQLTPTYHFYVQDHLGNNRLVVDEGGTIEQVSHYYPYGGLMGESKNISSNQRYKYNGKEFDRMHGLDWYDYGARYHDPAIVRWFSVDQLAEKYRETSPYVYCANNPIKHIDPDGKEKISLLSAYTNGKSNKDLYKEVRSFKDEKNVINIWAHGSPKAIVQGAKCFIDTPEKFVALLNRDSKVWQNRKDGDKIIIVLHSCKASAFAQTLSESSLLEDVLIVAPTENLTVETDQTTGEYIRSEVTNETDANKISNNRDEVSFGKWRV